MSAKGGPNPHLPEKLSPEEQFARDQEQERLLKIARRNKFERQTASLSQFARETFLSGRTGIGPILGRRDISLAAAAARGPKRT